MATRVASRAVTTAMAIAGRGARACDVCTGKSARWYCGADAAYLCDRCDSQVHSANSLSLRHERVRLTPSGVPAAARKTTTDLSPPPRKRSISKILHTPVPQVLPSRKRSRTTRLHPHHRHRHQQHVYPYPHQPQQELQLFKPLNPEPKQSAPKQSTEAEELHELITFDDLFDTEDFLIVDDDTHEVPSLITVSPQPSPSSTEPGSTELDSSSFDAFSPDFHAASSPSEDSNFAAYFKGKAALDDDVMSDHFLVPEHDGLDTEGDPIACDVDGGITLTGEACFIPGEIPDLDCFEEFGSRELGSLSFDLDPSPDETVSESSPSNVAEPESDRFASGPFAKFFASRPKPEPSASQSVSPESMKSEAKEILRCCREGLSEEDLSAVPSLQLNYDDVIMAWSDRGEPWVNPDGLVPDMDNGDDDDPSSGGREARVLRYKEKRRSRLFSKTIRYEVRKLNAERRPRMKGRFVKRTNNS